MTRDYRASPPVTASESRLVQLVLNLVLNAAQAIGDEPPRDGEILVRVEGAKDGRVRLEVTDNGSGIAPQHLARIFDPFFTTKPPGVGTGLGLSICHGIVKDLGGDITVDTAVGRGSSFGVSLPAAVQPATDSAPAPDRETPGGRPRVLLVDDEVRYATSLRMLLEVGHEVSVALDARSALAALASGQRFDVVLCDLMMAGMNGMDLYDALAKDHPELLSRVVFLTGGATNDRTRAFLLRPEIRHLEKPVDVPTLEHTIRAVGLRAI